MVVVVVVLSTMAGVVGVAVVACSGNKLLLSPVMSFLCLASECIRWTSYALFVVF